MPRLGFEPSIAKLPDRGLRSYHRASPTVTNISDKRIIIMYKVSETVLPIYINGQCPIIKTCSDVILNLSSKDSMYDPFQTTTMELHILYERHKSQVCMLSVSTSHPWSRTRMLKFQLLPFQLTSLNHFLST